MKRLLGVLLVGSLAACGGSEAVCGNGQVEAGEQCDKGADNGADKGSCSSTCKLQSLQIASLQVFYYRLRNSVQGFTGSACSDLGIAKVKIDVAGPQQLSAELDCSADSKMFNDVAPGTYTATVTLFDKDGVELTTPVASEPTAVAAPNTVTVMVNFLKESFIKQDYTGSLYFTPKWGGTSQACDAAGVDKQSVKLKSADGKTMGTFKTKSGKPLDGQPANCFAKSNETPFEQVDDLPWGEYTLSVAGRANGGKVSYCKSTKVFVGPGVSNPVYELTADSATSCPDAEPTNAGGG